MSDSSTIYNDEFRRFVREHRADDPVRLRLKYHGEMPPWQQAAIEHLDSLRRCGTKFVADDVDYAPDVLPSRLSVEQSTSARIALFHASLVPEASSVLDMTAGLGMDAVMMVRKGCDVMAVELNPCHAAALRHNLVAYDNVKVVEGDSVAWLEDCDRRFDVIFIDPARRGAGDSRVYNIRDCQPDLVEIMPMLRKHTGRVVAKLSPMLDVTQTLRDLKDVRTLYIVGDNTECKELLADIQFDMTDRDVEICVVGKSEFRFTLAEEQAAATRFGVPVTGDYIYEPSPAMMKAGAFRLLSQRYDVAALSVNTHVYFSVVLHPDFPGRVYRADAVLPYSSSVIKRFAANYPDVNEVAVRNFDMTAEALRTKIKVRKTGGRRVIGVSDENGMRHLLVVSKLTDMG